MKRRGLVFPLGVIACLLAMTALQQCADIVETDISNREVFLFAPAEGTELDSGAVTFVWDAVADASDYQLTVVSPDFDLPGRVYADTFLTRTNFTLALDSGRYSWGVRALNSVYSTAFFTNSFRVRFGDVNNLPVDPPVLVAPGDGISTDSGNVNFVWEEVIGASRYRLRIGTPNLTTPDLIVLDSAVSSTGYQVSLSDGSYEWGVRSENDAFQSAFTTRSLTIASGIRDPLELPVLVSPANGAVLDSGRVTLLWDAQVAAEQYQLRMLSPSFANATITVLDSVLTDTRLEIVLDRGSYEWGVKAANSAFETDFVTRTLTVQ
ncbi:MAG: hypothetical protein AAGA85_21200 [Bacteroidota bacterium]